MALPPNSYIVIDLETGGKNPGYCDILEMAAIFVKEGETVAELCRYLTSGEDSSEASVHVSAEALRVNKIRIDSDFFAKAVPYAEYLKEFHRLLNLHFPTVPEQDKIGLLGHNIGSFDNQCFEKMWNWNFHHVVPNAGQQRKYDTYFDYRLRDTSPILAFLVDRGALPPETRSLGKACEYFGIINENPHSALDDARATLKLYKKLLSIIPVIGANNGDVAL